MRVLVCGGRYYADRETLEWALEPFSSPDTVIIHGDAPGADFMADQWAYARNIPVKIFSPDWEKHGRAAGPIRNQAMLDEGKPDLVIAFPGGRGTADMVRRARAAGVKVIEVEKKGARYD